MELKQIQELIRFVSKSGVEEVEIEKGNFKITIKTTREKEMVNPTYVMQSPAMAAPQQQVQVTAPVASEPIIPTPVAPVAAVSKGIEIKAPMIGTFYRSAGPNKDAFVKVGDTVQKGQVICIIEAMKLFNEIEAEVSGTIVKALVDDASPVEYDQPLFLVEPA